MKRQRTWISLLGYCALLTLAAALTFAIIIAGGSVALAGHQSAAAQPSDLSAQEAAIPPDAPIPQAAKAFIGMITDAHCGARHMRNTNLNSSDCARACYRKGASYILVDARRQYTLVGGDGALDKLVGERAKVVGSLQGDAILVDSAEPIVATPPVGRQ